LRSIEEKYDINLPSLYRRLYEDGMLDWTGGYGYPIPSDVDWAEDIYPKLHANPPILFHTGGDILLWSPRQILSYDLSDDWSLDRWRIVPIGEAIEEDHIYALVWDTATDTEPMVAIVWDDDEVEIIAKNLEDFILLKMVEAATEIDKETLDREYGAGQVESYRDDILLDLKRTQPYLNKQYINLLTDLYHGQKQETTVTYWFEGQLDTDRMMTEMTDFDMLNNTIDLS